MGANQKIFPEHPQGGGHPPKYRTLRFQSHSRSIPFLKKASIVLSEEHSQARWLKAMMSNRYFPAGSIIHYYHPGNPNVTTANGLREAVSRAKTHSNQYKNLFAPRPWFAEMFFSHTVPTWIAWGFTTLGLFWFMTRLQWNTIKFGMNK